MKKLMQLLRDNAAQERKPLNLVRAAADANEATLYLYDVIDAYWGISAQTVAQAIAGLDKNVTLHLRINSPGGDVFEAEAMATAIRQHPGKTVAHIDGLAASAATRVASAAGEVEISEGSFYMIHNAWTIALGDKRDLTAAAALLDKVVTAGAPDMLLGYPLVVNDDVAAMAANAKSIGFGDFSQYKIRDVRNSFSVRRFDDSAFALNGQVGFCGWQRCGGNLMDTAAVKYYQNSAT